MVEVAFPGPTVAYSSKRPKSPTSSECSFQCEVHCFHQPEERSSKQSRILVQQSTVSSFQEKSSFPQESFPSSVVQEYYSPLKSFQSSSGRQRLVADFRVNPVHIFTLQLPSSECRSAEVFQPHRPSAESSFHLLRASDLQRISLNSGIFHQAASTSSPETH